MAGAPTSLDNTATGKGLANRKLLQYEFLASETLQIAGRIARRI
jgi:hypothetical protein